MSWWLLPATTLVSTLAQDTFHTAGVALIAHGRRWLACHAEGAEAVLIFLAASFGGYLLTNYPPYVFGLAAVAVFVGAELGGWVGLGLSDWLEARYRRPVRHRRRRRDRTFEAKMEGEGES